jgi:hypothetical protein
MQTNTFSVSNAYRLALEWWRNEAQYVYYLLFPAFVAMALSTLIMPSNTEELPGAFGFPGLALYLVLQFLYFLLFTAATASLLFFVATNKKEKWENWGKYLRILPKYIVVNILFALMVFVGLIFLIVPGIYLMLRYAFVSYRVLEHPEESISDLFAHEAERTAGYRWSILGLLLTLALFTGIIMSLVSTIAWALPEPFMGLILNLVDFFFTYPLALLTALAAYHLLNTGTPAEAAKAAPVTEEAKPVIKDAEVIEFGA